MDKLTQSNVVTLDPSPLQQRTVCNSPSVVLLVQSGPPVLADLQVSQSWTAGDMEVPHIVSVDGDRLDRSICQAAVSLMSKQTSESAICNLQNLFLTEQVTMGDETCSRHISPHVHVCCLTSQCETQV